jgi:hypothetical protein
MTETRLLIGVLAIATVVGWGVAVEATSHLNHSRHVLKDRDIELARLRGAMGLEADVARRIEETQRRAVELELERTALEVNVRTLQRQIKTP